MKKFQVLLYVASVVIAVSIGLGQTSSEARITLSKGLHGSGGAGCDYSGYKESDCITEVSGCTSGKVKAAFIPNNGEGKQDFKKVYNILGIQQNSVRGNCAGNSDCKTPSSPDLKSNGCEG